MVTINLLPQKTKRLKTGHVWLALVGVIWLFGAGFMGWMYYDDKTEVERMRQEITVKEKLISRMEKRQQTAASPNTLEQYLKVSERVQHLFYPTTLLLDQLASNLPVMGKLEKISYNLNGSINVVGKFEQYEDIAAYLHNLQLSPYVLKAEVKSITAIPVKWVGPVDEEGKPLSAALQAVGGNVLPRYGAVIDIVALTFDVKELKKIVSSTVLNNALQEKANTTDKEENK